MPLNDLTAISPIDGRYSNKTSPLREYFSEFALMKYRLMVEIEWFIFLSLEKSITNLPSLNNSEQKRLRTLYQEFSVKESRKIKTIEKRTNHDVKAIEYFIKDQLSNYKKLDKYSEFVHFACTSEDINNLAYSLMIADASEEILLKEIDITNNKLKRLSKKYATSPMVSRTHGQIASPTTMGKELANFVYRIGEIQRTIKTIKLKGKINGAVGNFNAHKIAYPRANWQKISERFIKSLGLSHNPYTTQIEPKDTLVELLNHYQRLSNVLIDLSRDIWGYISLNYFSQTLKKGEVGSSTMPHKVNPIDFENAEGNLNISKGIFFALSDSIQISRWQRDLSDSTSMRNVGVGFSHILIALKSLQNGLDKLKLNQNILKIDLDNSLEVLTEAIQTIIRKNLIPGGYELMKDLSRGKKINKLDLHQLIDEINVPSEEKQRLKDLDPSSYIGIADILAKQLKDS